MHVSPVHDAISHGEHLFHTGHLHEALRVFEAVIEQEPQNLLARNNRGVLLHSLGMYAEAERTFLEVLAQDAAHANAVVNLITLYLEQGRFSHVEAVLHQHGQCLSTQDIDEVKAQLCGLQNAMNQHSPAAPIKLLNISMDVKAKRHNVKLYVHDTEPSHRVICQSFANNQLYKPGVSNFFASVLCEADSVIDIGAHIGYFSVLSATLVGEQGRVLAFEPEARHYRRLQDNIALNQCQNVTSFAMALGAENTTARLFINADDDAAHALWNVGRHAAYLQSRMHCTTQNVQVASLDSVLHGADLPKVKLITIDTCGAEFEIIQGAVSTILAQAVPYVVCGINRFGLQQMGTSEQELRQFMGYMGYDTYWIRAEVPHLVPLAPDQYVESDNSLYVLFARPGL